MQRALVWVTGFVQGAVAVRIQGRRADDICGSRVCSLFAWWHCFSHMSAERIMPAVLRQRFPQFLCASFQGKVIALGSSGLTFDADLPIKKSEQDLIGRMSFAESLSGLLKSAASPDPLVIGLYGAWGSGKTSVVNLVENELCCGSEDGGTQLAVVRFEPWNYLTAEQLLAQFLKDVGSALQTGTLREKGSEVLEAFADYSGALMSSATSIAFSSGDCFAAPLAGAATSVFVGRLVSRVKRSAAKVGSVSSKKKALEKALLKFDGRVVVIIDDVDRLPNDQVRMVFQLVASLAKLPKINYLLSFDEEVVTRALGEIQKCDGSEYLEKVVQIPIKLPSISAGDLERILFRDLETVFEMFSYRQDDLDDTRWGGIRRTFLKNRFATIRDVRRFTNALMAKLTILPRFCCFEDVVALTVIELEAPQLADWIRAHKDYLCGSMDPVLFMGGKSPQTSRGELESQLGSIVPKSDAEWAFEAVCRLFPRVANGVGANRYAVYSNESLNAIWRVDSFDLYFHSNMPDGIDVHEVQDAMNVYDEAAVFAHLRGHAESGDLIDFVSALRTRVATLADGRASIVAKACLLALGISEEKRFVPLASTSANLELTRLVDSLFERIGAFQSECVLQDALNESEGRILFPLACFTLRQMNALDDSGDIGRKVVLSEASVYTLADSVCDKVCGCTATENLFLNDECHLPLNLLEKRRAEVFDDYAESVANADGVGCASFLSFVSNRCTEWSSDKTTSFVFDKEKVAKVVDPLRAMDLLAKARVDGSFFGMPEDAQLASAAYCIASEDPDRNRVIVDDAKNRLEHWRRERGQG